MKPEKISTIIESARPHLSTDESASLWHSIEAHFPTTQPIVSPYLFIFKSKKTMTAVLIALLIILSGSGTVYASDAARPGDFLFPLDRSLENARLRLAFSDESRTAFEKSLTEERLEELREIIDEEIVISPSNIDNSTTIEDSIGGGSTLFIEAHVFTDTSIVKIELGDKKFYFDAGSVKSREEIIASIQQKFPVLTVVQIEDALSFEIEDRESRPKDRGIATFSPKGHERVDSAVHEILSFLNTTSDLDEKHRKTLLSVIENETRDSESVTRDGESVRIGDDESRYEIKVNDDGDSRIEVRGDEGRVRIEQKDGEVRVQTKEREEVSKENVSVPSVSALTSLEIEAEIFTDTTVVKVASADSTFTFETSAESRNGIISAIQKQLPALTAEQIRSALTLSTEGRAYRVEDVSTPLKQKNDDDDSWEDEDDSHEDEDKDEDDSSESDD